MSDHEEVQGEYYCDEHSAIFERGEASDGTCPWCGENIEEVLA